MFSYRSLLKQAWQVTWRHKYLWFFGLFAALVVGSSAWEYQALSQNLSQGVVNGSYYQMTNFLAWSQLFSNFGSGLVAIWHQGFWTFLSVLSILLVTLFILIFFIWLAVTSQAGLIGDVKKIIENKHRASDLRIRSALSSGHKHFWSVLGLDLTVKILTAAIFFIVSLPLLFMVIKQTAWLAILYVILFVIFVPLSVSLGLMINYAINYRVLDNYSFIKSLEKAWKLFIDNWLVSLEIGLILFLINFAASLTLIILMSLFLLPLLMLGLLLNLNWLVSILIALILLILFLLGAILTTFQISSWTALFLRLKNKGVIAKLERLFGRA